MRWYHLTLRGVSAPRLGKQIMKIASSFAASSAVALLSTALLSGPAVSQIGTGSASSLPSVTVDAPRQVARPNAPRQSANTGVTRRTTAQTRSAASNPVFGPNTVLGRVARLEKAASSCNGGCETSHRVGNAPWVGCNYGGGGAENLGVSSLFSPTCTDTLTYTTYLNCTDTKTFLGATQKEARWICSSLHAGGKLTQEKVAQFKQSGR